MRPSFSVIVFVTLPAVVAAQDTLHFVPKGKLAIRDMRQVPWDSIAPGVRAKTVVGSMGSVSMAEIAPGSRTTPHHHTRQQVNVGLSGEAQFQLDTATFRLHRGDWVMVRSDVTHGIANASDAPAQLLELHSVRRLDLVPPYPSVTWPRSASPRSVLLWGSVHRAYDSTTFAGPMSYETTSVLVDQVRNFTINVGPASEEFAYIVSGTGTVHILGDTREQRIGPGSLIVMPAAAKVVVQSPDRNRILIVTLSVHPPPALR